MLVWDEMQLMMQRLSQDSTADTHTNLKQYANTAYKEVLARLGRRVTERRQTATTVADQRAYQMPPDFMHIVDVTYTVGSTLYHLCEEESTEYFNYRMETNVSGVPEVYYVRPRFGFSGAEILLDPRPSGANTLTITYEATDRDLSVDKYTTGTASVTTGSASVTGSGTVWTAAMIGRYFKNTDPDGDGLWYKIVNRSSDTAITLENVYEGSTDSSVNYQISECFALPEELQVLPVYYALSFYFGSKGNEEKEASYLARYERGLKQGRDRYASTSRSAIIKSKKSAGSGRQYPRNFPSSGIT